MYYYAVIPFYTNPQGQQYGTSSSIAKVTTPPATDDGYALQETLEVPMNGTDVTSVLPLLSGQTYLIVASESVSLGNGYAGDASYWYSTSDPQIYGSTIQGANIGLELGTAGGLSFPQWGPVSANHTYTLVYIGAGNSLSFKYDAPTASTSLSANVIDVDIYTLQLPEIQPPTPPSSSGNQPSLLISVPGLDTDAEPGILSAESAIDVQADLNGSSVPWDLSLTGPSSFSEILASSGSSSSSVTTGLAQVASLLPSLFQGGVYTLSLATTYLSSTNYSTQLSISIQPPVVEILSPATLSNVIPTVSSNTPIDILVADAQGTNVPWQLTLVPASGSSTVLASGAGSAGYLPGSGVQVATLDPALFPNGAYTLELSTTYTDVNANITYDQPISIDTIAKIGNFSLPVTDATLSTVIGPLSISRTYDTNLVNSTSIIPGFGPGWSFDLLNSQLTVIGDNDTLNLSQTTPILRAGDLVSMIAPNGSKYVFEFDPVPFYQQNAYASTPDSIQYLPYFLPLDGSGATLTLPASYSFTPYGLPDAETPLAYDAASNEYVRATYGPDFGYKDLGFNPGGLGFHGEYYLTTSAGISYIIYASTGQIASISDKNGETITFARVTNSDFSSTITATTATGTSVLTIDVSPSNLITQIQIPGQNSIDYNYTNGELTSVVNQTGDTTLYAYQYAGNVDFLTGIANDQGQVILQAQYDPSTELLDGLITASGISVPVSSSALGPNDAMQTVVDAAGNITEDVYDEKTGILLRAIQVLQDSSGDITGYIVDPMSYSYVIDESGQMSSLRSSGAEVLQQVDSFNSFEVSGADPSGLRYSEQPAAASLEKHVEFDTSNDPDDPARGQIVSSSEQVNATGTLQTTLYQNFILADFQTASYEPQQVTTEVQTPDIASATGYDSYIQTQTFSVYDTADSNDNLLEVLKVVARDLSPATDQQPTERSQTKVFSDVAEGGYPLMLYAVLSGFSVNADNAVQTLQWNAAMAAYVWSDSSGTDTVEIKLQDTSEASDSGTSKAADDWTLTVEDTGSSGSDGVIGTLAGVSFDGTVADFSSLLDQLFSSPSHFQDATTLTTFSSLPQFSAAVPDWVAEGTEYTYSSNANDNLPAGLLLSTQAVTALINADGSIVPGSTAAVSSQDLSQNTYYDASDYSGDTPDAGASYGQVMYSFNSAGQETYYAYDQSGRVILQYTYEQWTGSNGQPVDGWVGTTNVYNSGGQLTDTYSATYVDNASDAQQTDHILPVILTSSESSNPYSSTAVPIFDIDTNQADSNAVTECQGQAPLHTLHNDYNTLGQLADSIDVYGGETIYTYDANGNKIRTHYPNGTESLSIYDSDNRVIWSTDAFSPSGPADFIVGTYTDYNALGEVIETQTYEGTAINIGTAQSGSATVNVATLASAGTLISTSTSVYDAAGHVIETINPNGLITGSIYYPNGQVEYSGILNAAISESNGVASADLSLSQFAQMNVNGVMENTYTQNIYDQYDPAYGLYYSTSVDQLGNPTKTYSNSLGQIVRTVYADNSFTETLYGVGSVAVSSDQEGDAISDPAGTSMSADLSAKGGYEEVTIAQRNLGDAPVVTYDLYNVAGELTDVWQPAVTDADPTSPTYGQLVQPHWTYVYDTAGSEVVQISPMEQVAFLSWTEDGNTPASFTGGTSFGYDQYGKLVSKQLPDGELQTWSYDQYQENVSHKVYSATNHTMALQTTLDIYNTSAAYGGRLQTEDRYSTDQAVGSTATPNEQTIYTYDDSTIDQGYMLAVQDYLLQGGTLQLGDFTNYTYDPITGNEASITTADGTINYVYDSTTGLLTETWTGTNHSSPQNDVLYGYTNLGQLASVTQMVLNGTTTSTSGSYVLYDALGNQHSTDRPTTVYTYDAAGNLVTLSDANGDNTSYSYNDRNELFHEVVTNSNSNEPIFDEHTDWYSNGQKQDVIDTRYTSTGSVFSQITYNWTYDADNRLEEDILTVQTGGGSSVPSPYADIFSYDLDNNRTLETEAPAAGNTPTETISYTYNGDDQLVTQIGSGTNNYAISNQYDANGNLWNSANTSGGSTITSTYGYDLRNRMTSADINGTTSNYTYDWNGVLTSETTGGNTTYYLNDPNNPTGYSKAIQQSTVLSGSPTLSYVIGLEVEAQSDTTNGTRYLLIDGHGSTRALTNTAGALVPGQSFDYDAFGTTLTNSVDAESVCLFGGDGVYDRATGFTYQLARWRDGFSFTQIDPFPGILAYPSTLPRYSYVTADPTFYYDPTGAVGIDDLEGDAAQVGAETGEALSIAAEGAGATEGLEEAVTEYAADFDSELEADGAEGLNEAKGLNVNDPVPEWMQEANDFRSEPNATDLGNEVHYDGMTGASGEQLPTKLQEDFPNTEFEFTPRGARGADVKVTGGTHPSDYPDTFWEEGNDSGDFKPGNSSGGNRFMNETNSGKLPPNTQYLPYDPQTGEPMWNQVY